MADEVLSMSEAADRLDIDTGDVFDLVLKRELGFTQSSTGRIEIPVDALTTYEEQRRVKQRS
jgi:hypothetical protein